MEQFKAGDLVFLTKFFEKYVSEKNPQFNVSLVNRVAKIEEIIDWSSEKGKKIKRLRELSGKWKNLSIEDSKYIISVYYHDLIGRKGEKGVIERGVPMFKCHPKTKESFFEKIPDWIFKEINKKCEQFKVETDDLTAGV